MNKNTIPDVANNFMNLVKIDSPTGSEKNMSFEVKRQLESFGLKPKLDQNGNVIASISGDKSKETLLLNAHLDTVEPGRSIKPKIDKSGWIYSDGTTILGADNKAGVAVILEVVKILAKKPSATAHPLEIVFTTSEESGNKGATNLDYKNIKSKVGYAFDISGHKFGDILVSSPFYNRIDIKMEGKATHAKEPEIGINVIPAFAKAISKMKLGRLSPNTLVNIGIVNIGPAVNSVPGLLVASGEVRSSVEKELRKFTKNIKKIFQNECSKAKIKLTFTETLENPGYKLSTNDKFLLETTKKLSTFGIKPSLINSFGCSDANIFAGHGIKVVNIAGGAKDAHSMKESIKVSDLEKLTEVVIKLINS